MKIKVLITAVNSSPGRAVLNSLKNKKNLQIYYMDSDESSVFFYQKDKNFFLAPKAKEKSYKKFINNLIKKKKINIIIPCIEPEVLFFSKNQRYFAKKVKMLLPPFSVINKVTNKSSALFFC